MKIKCYGVEDGWLGEKAKSWVVLEVVEGLNESFIRSTEKGSGGRKRESMKERQSSRIRRRRRRRLFKGERRWFFWPIRRSRRSVVGSPGEPGPSPLERRRSVWYRPQPPHHHTCPQADRVRLQISLMKPLASSLQAGLIMLQKVSS